MKSLLRGSAMAASIAPGQSAVNQFQSKYFILHCKMTVNE
jgi:hypothetical protein